MKTWDLVMNFEGYSTDKPTKIGIWPTEIWFNHVERKNEQIHCIPPGISTGISWGKGCPIGLGEMQPS